MAKMADIYVEFPISMVTAYSNQKNRPFLAKIDDRLIIIGRCPGLDGVG